MHFMNKRQAATDSLPFAFRIFSLLFSPASISTLIDMEDTYLSLNVSFLGKEYLCYRILENEFYH